MPGLVRKLLIFAAVDGLILQPAPPRNHPPTTQQAIKIDYKGNIQPLLKDRRDEDTAPQTLEAHGIIGEPRPPRAPGKPAADRDPVLRQACCKLPSPPS